MNQFGIKPPRILLPKKDMEKWAVIACDQYTSEPHYWEQCEKIVGECPSTLRIMLPEAYLGRPDEQELIEKAKSTMREYIDNHVLEELEEGFVLVRRQTHDGLRIGLVASMDLEHYDYTKGAKSLIRPTEDTIQERIPPRLRIRKGGCLELPHIMVLVDDAEQTLIEPLLSEELPVLYDFELMQGGGRIQGSFVGEKYFAQMEKALEALFAKSSMLFAVGDGNHSLATAKAHWEEIKKTLSEQEQQTHPARFALVELVNLHCEGLLFHPIHRVVFDYPEALSYICKAMQEKGLKAKVEYFATQEQAQAAAEQEKEYQAIAVNAYGKPGVLYLQPNHLISYGTLQPILEEMGKNTPAKVDYIHGDDSLMELSKNGIGFFMPSMAKESLFPSVEQYGALPKKTFSMGLAQDKRYYLECKRITY